MSWIDHAFPRTATPSGLVGRVLGLNPGMMTGPGTNTYLVGRRDPILIDTGAGVADYLPLLERYLAERGFTQPSRVILTHRHRDHMGGVDHLRARFKGLRVAKMIHRDAGLPEPIEDLRDGQKIEGEGVTLIPVYTTAVIPSDDGDLADYMSSLRRLQQLDVRRIYPAHGPVIEDAPAKIQEFIDHRMMRERQILDALGDGLLTIPAMVERIYADVPKALHSMAAMSVESHLKKLRRDGRVTETIVRDAPSRWALVG